MTLQLGVQLFGFLKAEAEAKAEEQILAKFGGQSSMLLCAYLETTEHKLKEALKCNPMSFHQPWQFLISSSAASPIDLPTHSPM